MSRIKMLGDFMNWRQSATIGIAFLASFVPARAADIGWQKLGNSVFLFDQFASASIAVPDQPLILTRWTGSLVTTTSTGMKATLDDLHHIFDGKWIAAYESGRTSTVGSVYVNPSFVSIVYLHACTAASDTCADLKAPSGQILGQARWTEQAQALLKLK
jgi:hypothetical protein